MKSQCHVVLILAMFLTAACGRSERASSEGIVRVSTRLKWLPGATYIGSAVAKEAGFWNGEGLDVTVMPGGFDADPIKLVAAGSNDFGITGGEQLLQARSQGVPIVAIFMELQRSPAGWMSLTSSGIQTPQHFVGRKIGAAYGTNIEPTLDALLGKLGIDGKSLQRVPVKFDVSPLYTAQVDVFPVYLNGQPVQARLEGREVNTIDPSEYGVSLYGNVYFTTEKMIRERPELVQRFVNGLRRGWEFALASPDSAIALLVKSEPRLDRSLEDAIWRSTVPYVTGQPEDTLGLMNESRWAATRDIMVRYGGLAPQVDIKSAFTNTYVRAAIRQ